MDNEMVETPPELTVIPGLTVRQSAFVEAMASGEHDSGKAAAIHAGYAETHAANAAHHNLRNATVLEAISARTLALIAEHAPRSLRSMAKLSTSAKSEMVRQVASKDILDRAGFKPPDRHMVAVGGSVEIAISRYEG